MRRSASADASEDVVVQNKGMISGTNFAYQGQESVVARDLITNTGKMIGAVQLGAGDDRYDGSKGRLDGDVQ